eukprot:6174086-Pleurochrysis_carterae.AAC.1
MTANLPSWPFFAPTYVCARSAAYRVYDSELAYRKHYGSMAQQRIALRGASRRARTVADRLDGERWTVARSMHDDRLAFIPRSRTALHAVQPCPTPRLLYGTR